MSSAGPPGTSNNVVVKVLGLLTLLLGGAYASFGGWAILAGVDWFAQRPDKDALKQVVALGGIVPAFIIVFGVVFLALGIVVLLAALGVLLRKQWSRILTVIVAALAIVLGLLWISGVQDVIQDATAIAIGASQVLYGIVAFVILVTNGAAFSRA